MLSEPGDLWTKHAAREWVVISTNGVVNRLGKCVMGAGVAKQAAARYPNLAREVGRRIADRGNRVYVFTRTLGDGSDLKAPCPIRLITMPVKHHWRDDADLRLIERSARQLVDVTDALDLERVYLPRIGAGNGHLPWGEVQATLDPLLDHRFIALDYPDKETL